MRTTKTTTKRRIATAAATLVMLLQAGAAAAGDIGHFNPGLLNIRDLLVPDPGFYGALYQYYYTTDRVNDADGDKVRSIEIHPGPGPGVTLGVDVDLDIYALVPTLIWVTDFKILGAKYGALVVPTFANSSVSAALSNQQGLGRNADNDSFGLGDWFFQPLWLGWTVPNFDVAFGYGFYAPTGKYDTEPVALPSGDTIRVESADNIGYGYFTHQLQAAGAWYPWKDKRMAVVLGSTYEINHEKEDFDVTAGQVVTLNWGVSQYLPVVKDHSLLAELGLTGYDSWQVSDDSGSDAANDLHDSVHAVGGQLGLTHVPWGAVINFHYLYEFAAEDRFQGHVVGLSLIKKI